MSKTPEITVREIENAVAAAGASFTLASVARALGAGRSDVVRRRLESFISNDSDFFYTDSWHCRRRDDFFSGREFLITPDEWELSENILLPGHRFIPFMPESVFPSEVKMFCRKSGKTAGMKKLTAPLGRLFHYHLLLGSEQVFDFLMADDQANAVLAKQANSSSSVTLNVFDMADFYRENDFAFGDALLCRVKDYNGGEIEFEMLSGANRSAAARKERIAALDEAMKKVWDKFRDYPDIPEQLAWAEFFADGSLPGASADEFIANSQAVEIHAEGDHAVLVIADHSENAAAQDILPDGLRLSDSELDDPLKILSLAGTPLNYAELDAFILDAVYNRESDISGIMERIFKVPEPEFADDVQEAVLMNFLEERFEEIQQNYNRADDEIKAELRSQILDAVCDRLNYLTMLGSLDRDTSESENANIRELAAVAAKFSETLKLLNNPAFTPDDIELENLASMLDAHFDRQDELIGNMD